jgi:HSP20 family molecular chaperone IbpA
MIWEGLAMNDTTAVAGNETGSRSGAVSRTESEGRNDTALMPPVDVIEDATGITLRADLPGVPKDKLHLHVEADVLTIEGELGLAIPEGMEASYAEVGVPRFRRVFTLSKELEPDQVTAELRNGVLNLRIPKAARAQPRRIDIKAS